MEVSDQIIKVLDEIGKKFGLIVDWTQKNITPYIQDLGQRIVKYEIYTSIVWMTIGVILLLLGIVCFVFITKDKNNKIDSEGIFFVSMAGVVLIAIGLLTIGFQTFDIIKAVTLPESIWLDYLQQYLPK